MARTEGPRPQPWRRSGVTLNGLALVFLVVWFAAGRPKWPAVVAALLLLAAVVCYLAELFAHTGARR